MYKKHIRQNTFNWVFVNYLSYAQREKLSANWKKFVPEFCFTA